MEKVEKYLLVLLIFSCLGKIEAEEILSDIIKDAAAPACKPNTKYRTIDGTCNNLDNGNWGKSFSTLVRLLPPQYADGNWSLRQARSGKELPNARVLSTKLIQVMERPSPRYTYLFMQFSQFFTHDLTLIPFSKYIGPDNSSIPVECCNKTNNIVPQEKLRELCAPILIPADDKFYGPHGRRCLNFVRSVVSPKSTSGSGFADQINHVTHYIDSSNIYGSSEKENKELREFSGGRLKRGKDPAEVEGRSHINENSGSGSGSGSNQRQLPAFLQIDKDRYKGTLPRKECDGVCPKETYSAGDERVNQNLGLVSAHLIWFREHNRIANILKGINPHWKDERLFQEARRIVIAENQHIIYNEWLPIALGKTFMKSKGLLPQSSGYFKGHNPKVDPRISNSFQVAAFRIGHTMVPGILPLTNDAYKIEAKLPLSNHTNTPTRIEDPKMVDNVLRGLSETPMSDFDSVYSVEIVGFLFKGSKPVGIDLAAVSIQRGRDQGIPGYNSYRKFCNLTRAKAFTDFQDHIPLQTVTALRKLYDHVDDVDLYVGGLLETPAPGALLGPTFQCIVGEQFLRTKIGDRFWYENGAKEHAFTPDQLKEVRKASFSRVLCDNGDSLGKMQPFAFVLPDAKNNPRLDCTSESIPKMDLRKWKEKKQ